MGPSLSVEATTTAVIFEAYVEKVLTLHLQSGQVMVMDNLSAHNKGKRVRELIEGRGCQILLYLPAYSSPDFNPVEQAISKLKDLLRKAEAQGREALVDALGMAISAVSARDTRGFFEHWG
jgi:transposase